MRKIDKTKIFASQYKTWIDSLDKQNKPHPPYNSSNNEYYYDIVMNLLYCQRGLCAYTEVKLYDISKFKESDWKDGKYLGEKNIWKGQLDHFVPKADKNFKSYWSWDNFFMVESDTNRVKSNQSVDVILKPDREGYDEFQLFDYDSVTHMFIANTDLPNLENNQVEKMIDLLGLNHCTLVSRRKEIVESAVNQGANLVEFPTAIAFYRMSKRK